jgi:hypothetical protein
MWAKFIKDYLRMLQTKFCDHPSIISVGYDFQRGFSASATPKTGKSNKHEQTW